MRTLCNACHVIIETGLTNALLCEECKKDYDELSLVFDSKHRVLKAVKEIAEKRRKKGGRY